MPLPQDMQDGGRIIAAIIAAIEEDRLEDALTDVRCGV